MAVKYYGTGMSWLLECFEVLIIGGRYCNAVTGSATYIHFSAVVQLALHSSSVVFALTLSGVQRGTSIYSICGSYRGAALSTQSQALTGTPVVA